MKRNTALHLSNTETREVSTEKSSIRHPFSGAPVMTREAFAAAIGLPVTVLVAQAERGYWPELRVGKRVFINVELVRKRALEQEFSL